MHNIIHDSKHITHYALQMFSLFPCALQKDSLFRVIQYIYNTCSIQSSIWTHILKVIFLNSNNLLTRATPRQNVSPGGKTTGCPLKGCTERHGNLPIISLWGVGRSQNTKVGSDLPLEASVIRETEIYLCPPTPFW